MLSVSSSVNAPQAPLLGPVYWIKLGLLNAWISLDVLSSLVGVQPIHLASN